jgi:hypothetical protein
LIILAAVLVTVPELHVDVELNVLLHQTMEHFAVVQHKLVATLLLNVNNLNVRTLLIALTPRLVLMDTV